MAQVKKFKTPAGPVTVEDENAVKPAGTSTLTGEVKKKYGKLIRNGVTYEMDDEKMKNLEQHITSMDPELQPYVAEDFKRLQNGEDVTLDTMLNRRDGIDDYTLLNDRQERRLKKNKAKEGFLNALFNTKTHKFNKATYALGQWNPETKTKPEEEVKKTPFGRGAGSFEYESLADDKFSYRSVLNGDEMEHFDRIYNFFVNPNDRNKYDTSSFTNMSSLIKWFDDMKDEQGNPSGKKFLDTLKTKILSGDKLDQNERDYLDAIGIGHNQTPSQETIDAEEKVKADEQLNIDWNNFDTNKVWSNSSQDIRNRYFISDGRGGYSLNKDAFFKDFDPTKNYYFNQEFAETYKGMPGVKDLVGKIYFNGKWYSDKDLKNPASELYQMLNNAVYDYRNKNLRGDFDAANEVLKTNWAGTKYIPTSNEYLGPFYGSNYLYQDMNFITNGSKYGDAVLNKNWNLLKALNMDTPGDALGNRDWRYILTDAYGRYIDLNGNPIDSPFEFDNTKFSGLYTGQTDPSKQIVNRYTRLTNDPSSEYYNRYADEPIYQSDRKTPFMEGWLGVNGNSENAFVYFDKQILGPNDPVFADMPKNVYDFLYNVPFWNNYNITPHNKAKEAFSKLIETGENNMTKEYWEALLVPENIREAIAQYFTKNRRIVKRPVSPVQSNKSGGIIKYEQPSGPMGERKVDDKVLALSEQMKGSYAPATLGEEFTNTDWWDMAALGADVVGAGLGYVPKIGDVLNLIISGVGATALGAVADSRRVKHGELPKWTALKNAGANIGADVVSIVPVIGDTFNILTSVQRASRIVTRLMNSASALAVLQNHEAIWNSVQKCITNPSEMTIGDLRNVFTGVQMVAGTTKQAANIAKTSKLAAESAKPVDQRYKFTKTGADGKKTEQYLDKDDIAALTTAKQQKNIDAVMDQIATKYNLSDTDKAALKIAGPAGMGLQHNKPIHPFPNTVSEPSTNSDMVKYYWFHPKARYDALGGREAENLAGIVKSTERTKVGEEVYRQIKANTPKGKDPKVPEGYIIDKGKHWYQRPAVVKSPEAVQSNKEGGILKAKNGLGQWFNNAGEKINKFVGTYGHDIWNVVDSGARFANGILYNTKSEKLNKDATNRAANILQPVKPVEIYSPQKINAGNAERQFAESQLQYNPIPTNDMNTYQAMKKEGYDKAHLGLSNATRLDAQQDTENGMRGAEEKRHYANIASEYTNIGKKAVANAVLTNAQLKDTRLKANADSLNQLIYQGQAQRDEYRKEALAFMQEKDQWDLQDAMRKKFEEEKAKLFKDKPYDPGNAEHNKALNSLWKQIQLWGGEANLQNKFNRMSGGAQAWATNRGISFAAKGSKLRPTSEQIAINREKAKDQRQTNKEKSYNKMWENELKDAHKALDKMSERTHRILMKLLS